jgi:signal transduction histidine kinase
MASRPPLAQAENVVLRLHQPVPDEALPAALSSASVLLETTLSHLQLVRDEDLGPLTPDQLRFLGVAEQHAIRLGQVVEDLQLVALSRGGSLEPEWDAVELADLARNAVGELAGAAATRGKPIELRVEGQCRTVGDSRLLGRLLSGLLSVALDEGAPRLPIVLSVEGDGLEIEYPGESLPDTTRLGLVVADALSSALGGRLVAAVSEGTVTLRFDPPVEAAHAAA